MRQVLYVHACVNSKRLHRMGWRFSTPQSMQDKTTHYGAVERCAMCGRNHV